MTGLSWEVRSPETAAVLGPDGRAVARYEFGTGANHPFFRDVTPLNHQGVLTNHAPWDHSWHHGLWWSWKFVNDILFWEDNADFGGNRAGLGRAVVVSHDVEIVDGTVVVDEKLQWRVDASGEVLLTERRRMVLQADPARTDTWSIDWQHEWTAQVDCVLDSTPYPEHWWGGYAGLNFRAARSMRDGERIRASGGLEGREQVHAGTAQWAAYSGNVDGSETDDPEHPARGTFAILDHPGNGAAMPVYVFSAADEFGFLASAPLMHTTRKLAAGAVMTQQFCTVICGSDLEPATLDDLTAAYRDTPSAWKEQT